MKKGQPKRRDLRKRIEALEKENRELRFRLPIPTAISYRDPPTRITICLQMRKAISRDPARSEEIHAMNLLYRKNAIKELAKALAENMIEHNLVGITTEDTGLWEDTIRMTADIVPFHGKYPAEIQEALDFDKEDKA